MKKTGLRHRKRKGVVLIISVGILALVAMIATSFALNMQVEYRGAVNYLNSARATAMAQAGIDKAIADIRYWVANNSYSTVITNINNYSTAETALGNGFYQVTIGDTGYTREEQKVNINALDQTDSVWIDALLSAGLTNTNVGRLIDYRDPDTTETAQLLASTGLVNITGLGSNETNSKNAPYATVDELRLVLNDDAKYNAVKNMVTVYAPILKGGLIGKYYSDRYTFSKFTILDLANYRGKVVELGQIRQALELNVSGTWYPWGTMPGADGDVSGWAEAHDAEFAGGYIAEDWNPLLVNGFGLDQFGVIWTGFIYIPESKVGQPITFKVRSEDGFRVIIDNTTILEDWADRSEIGGWTNPPSGTQIFTSGGWHPIRIDFYNNGGANLFELKWDAFPASDYVPAEYLGYQPASYYGNQYNDSTQAFYAPTSSTGTLYTGYNSAGIFKITSKGRVKRSDGTLLSEKQITTVVKLFNTWTQTTRAEFYAPWFSLYNDFSDGETKNANWLDTCPTDTDYWNSTTRKMHWEESYATVPDSIKLGYWDNFDEDVAYSVINLKGGKMTTCNGVTAWTTVTISGTPYSFPKTFSYTDATSSTSHGEMLSIEGANGTHCLKLWNPAYKERYSELNSNYYVPSAALGYDIFVRTYTQDNGQQQTNSGNWGYPASNRLTNPPPPPNTAVYTPEWVEPHLEIKLPAWSGSGPASYYHAVLKDGDSDLYYTDEVELNVPNTPSDNGNVDADSNYPMDSATKKANPYILAAIGVGANYTSYYSYLITNNGTPTGGNFVQGKSANNASSTNTDIVQFNACNMYSIDYNWWDSSALIKISTRGGDWYGADSEDVQYFDNIRIIYPKGYLVSAPFVSKYSTDSSNIKWGTVSWTADTPANTSITMYVRSDDALATTDSSWTNFPTNGTSLSALPSSGRQIQYKALLATTALNAANYQNSSATPVLRDITITYMLPLETLYRK